MRKLLPILFIFCLTANITYAAPNYDPNQKWITYDTTYNVTLYNYLNDKFHKKYPDIVTKDSEGYLMYHVTYSNEARDKEVSQIYTGVMKNLEEEMLSNDKNKSKDELMKEILEDIAYYNELLNNYHKACDPGDNLFDKIVEEEKKKNRFFNKHKLASEMRANGTMCSITSLSDMIHIPFHEKRMSKLRK